MPRKKAPPTPPQVPAIKALLESTPVGKTRREVTRTWKRVYLRELARHGRNGIAARVALVNPTTPNRQRRMSKLFDAACRRALARARDNRREELEVAVHHRAVYGTRKPVIANGVIIGYQQVYSDRLALAALAAENPRKWSPRKQLTRDAGPGPLMPPDAAKQIADPAIARLAAELAQALARRRQPEAEPIDVDAEEVPLALEKPGAP